VIENVKHRALAALMEQIRHRFFATYDYNFLSIYTTHAQSTDFDGKHLGRQRAGKQKHECCAQRRMHSTHTRVLRK
jgi:hypothetical protein